MSGESFRKGICKNFNESIVRVEFRCKKLSTEHIATNPTKKLFF